MLLLFFIKTYKNSDCYVYFYAQRWLVLILFSVYMYFVIYSQCYLFSKLFRFCPQPQGWCWWGWERECWQCSRGWAIRWSRGHVRFQRKESAMCGCEHRSGKGLCHHGISSPGRHFTSIRVSAIMKIFSCNLLCLSQTVDDLIRSSVD